MSPIALPDPPLSDGIGHWVAAEARGRGVALRAVRLITGWGLAALGFERMQIRTQIGNHASQSVAQRAGFERGAAPIVKRPECDHLPGVFFARLRPAGG